MVQKKSKERETMTMVEVREMKDPPWGGKRDGRDGNGAGKDRAE